jgi:ATP-dependent Clp protease ATP-binding subunit ClpA
LESSNSRFAPPKTRFEPLKSRFEPCTELTDAARHWLAKKGFDPAFGARPSPASSKTTMI